MELKLPGGQFCGEVLKSSNLYGIRLTETTYSPGLVLPKHSHEHACFIFTLRGSFYETYGKHSRVCKSFTLIYRPSDEVHSDHFYDTGGRCLNIEISPEWLELIRRPPISLDGSAAFEGGAVAGLAIKLYKEFQQSDDISAIAIEGLFLEIIAEVSPCRSPGTRSSSCSRSRRGSARSSSETSPSPCAPHRATPLAGS